MNERSKFQIPMPGQVLLSLMLFWATLNINIRPSFSQHFHLFSFQMFMIIFVLYYLVFCLPMKLQTIAGLSLTMLLFALPLSYLWRSGFSDNFLIGGLLPYKDGRNYYFGANLILNGLPVINANQATERPLFPGFLASILFFTGQNLKISIAFIAQLMGIGFYMVSQQIKSKLGVLAASLYAALLYFYIKPWIGYTLSETLGFAVGCFALTLLCVASHNLKWLDILLGLFVLVLAVSARAGAFFIFPLLVIWIGWVKRGSGWFSLKSAGFAFIFVLTSYFLLNSVYPRFLGIPPGSSFGNFSYTLYGQVRGGTGWHSAIEELNTRNPSKVYSAAWEFFCKHPFSLFIGFFKAYRDFFWFSEQGAFAFSTNGGVGSLVSWLGAIALTILGLIRLVRDAHSSFSALILAGFMGIFLSIPFLPPVDGGTRFYASTMPFLFTAPAVGLSWFLNNKQKNEIFGDDPQGGYVTTRFVALATIALVFFVPLLIRFVSSKPNQAFLPVCSSEQEVFFMETHQGSYIDMIKADSASSCGSVFEDCLSDFERNNTEKFTDDFYQEIIRLNKINVAGARILPAMEWVNNEFVYFYIPHDRLHEIALPNLMAGCAIRLSTKNQTIFLVETIK